MEMIRMLERRQSKRGQPEPGQERQPDRARPSRHSTDLAKAAQNGARIGPRSALNESDLRHTRDPVTRVISHPEHQIIRCSGLNHALAEGDRHRSRNRTALPQSPEAECAPPFSGTHQPARSCNRRTGSPGHHRPPDADRRRMSWRKNRSPSLFPRGVAATARSPTRCSLPASKQSPSRRSDQRNQCRLARLAGCVYAAFSEASLLIGTEGRLLQSYPSCSRQFV